MAPLPLPADVLDFVDRNLPPEDRAAAIEVLARAKLHDAADPGERLLRCTAVAGRRSLQMLRYYADLLEVDYRDVIVAGEYESRNGALSRVRDLNDPIPADL